MLLVEERLEALIEQLRALRKADRRAILRRLEAHERTRVEALLAGKAVPPMSRYSPALMERLHEAQGKRASQRPLTPAATRALLQATGQGEGPGPSLANAIGDLLKPRGRG